MMYTIDGQILPELVVFLRDRYFFYGLVLFFVKLCKELW